MCWIGWEWLDLPARGVACRTATSLLPRGMDRATTQPFWSAPIWLEALWPIFDSHEVPRRIVFNVVKTNIQNEISIIQSGKSQCISGNYYREIGALVWSWHGLCIKSP